MAIEIIFNTGIGEAGTAEFSEALAPRQLETESDAREAAPLRHDTVLALGSSVLAPGLSTPAGR